MCPTQLTLCMSTSVCQGVRIALTDGATHAVDSSDLAFKLASMYAFRQAYEAAKPVVLEPVMAVSGWKERWVAEHIENALRQACKAGKLIVLQPVVAMEPVVRKRVCRPCDKEKKDEKRERREERREE